MPLLQPENVCKISGKLLVESVVAPVGGRVPEDYSPNLVGFRDTMKPEPIELFFCVDYPPNKSSCILEDYQTFFVASTLVYVTWGEARILVQGIGGFLLLFMFSLCQRKKKRRVTF